MIIEIDPNLVAVKADYKACRKALKKALALVELQEKKIEELNATIAKQAIDLEFALNDKAELENALKFKPIYA